MFDTSDLGGPLRPVPSNLKAMIINHRDVQPWKISSRGRRVVYPEKLSRFCRKNAAKQRKPRFYRILFEKLLHWSTKLCVEMFIPHTAGESRATFFH